MKPITLRRPSAALVVATGALVVAFAGTGYALSVPRNSVGSAQLKSNAVLSSKIKNGQVMAADLATNAVTGAKIASSAVTSAKIAAGAVGHAQIAANAVTGSQIAAGTITFGNTRLGDFAAGPGAIVTIQGDVDSLTSTQIGTIDGFGTVTAGCQSGNIGQDQLTVNDTQSGDLTVSVQVSGAVTAATASTGGDASVDLGNADAAYMVELTTGTSAATLSLWRSTTGTGCHFLLQGVSNVS
jgi:hypothetical protein